MINLLQGIYLSLAAAVAAIVVVGTKNKIVLNFYLKMKRNMIINKPDNWDKSSFSTFKCLDIVIYTIIEFSDCNKLVKKIKT